VVAPVEQSEVDVLNVDGRPDRLSPRVRRLLLVLVLVAVVAGWLVDRDLRAGESRALDTCSVRTATAVDGALRRVSSRVNYVRPALEGPARGALRRDLYAMVSEAATGWDHTLRAALDTCLNTSVLVLHDDLRSRRASCAARIRATVGYLHLVARDGRKAFGFSPPGLRSVPGCAG
jgi:hypothetical protein